MFVAEGRRSSMRNRARFPQLKEDESWVPGECPKASSQSAIMELPKTVAYTAITPSFHVGILAGHSRF